MTTETLIDRGAVSPRRVVAFVKQPLELCPLGVQQLSCPSVIHRSSSSAWSGHVRAELTGEATRPALPQVRPADDTRRSPCCQQVDVEPARATATARNPQLDHWIATAEPP